MRVDPQRKSRILLPEEGGSTAWQINVHYKYDMLLVVQGRSVWHGRQKFKYSSNIPGLHQPVVPTEVLLTLTLLFPTIKNALLLKMAPVIFLKVLLGYSHMDSQITLGYCSRKTAQPVPAVHGYTPEP